MRADLALERGKAYRVKIKGQRNTVRRIFKYAERRFGDLQCFVFTSRVDAVVSATVDGDALTLRGKRLPSSEVSVPHYDLESCEPT